MGLTRLAIHRPLTVLMGLLGLVLMGGVAYTYLSVDRLPPITVGFVAVSISWPQASASDVEQLVIIPVENSISGMEGVASMNSTASEGSASVAVQLADGVDPDQAALEIGRRLNGIRNRLPADAGDPNVTKADPNATPLMNVALTGAPLDTLYDVATNQMVPQLESVVGVGSVNVSGGLHKQVQVQLNYARLAAYNLTPNQVTTALTNANVTSPVGTIPLGSIQQDVRAIGAFQNVNDIKNVVITQTANGPILVSDVANVSEGYADQTSYQRLDGQNAVGMSIVKTSGANEIQVDDGIQKELQKLKPLLPQGTQVVITNDSSVYTRAALDAIQHDLILSIFLVALVILLFLHDWRHTAIVLLSIPTSLISSFLFMYLFGFSLNVMTLMALALMIGILVDDSIVVLENIHRHLQMGESPWQAAINGRGEIGMAAIAITMADVVVYTPIAFMQGNIGQLFREYGLTIVVATLMSLLCSFTLAPMLASRWLSHDHASNAPLARFGRWWDRGFDRIGVLVSKVVPWSIRHRWYVVAASAVLVAAAVSLVPLGYIHVEYAPQEDDNNFSANLSLPPGTDLADTDDAARALESIVAAYPEVAHYSTNVSAGGGGPFGGGGGRVGVAVQLVPKDQRSRSVFDIINDLRNKARVIPNTTFNAGVSSPLGFGGGGGGLTTINMQISGPDLNVLADLAGQVQAVALNVPGLADVRNTGTTGTPEFELRLDRTRMAQLGITSQAVSTALRTAVGGTLATELRPDGQTQEDVEVLAQSTDRNSLQALMSIPVGTTTALSGATTGTGGTATTTGAGSVVTLSQIATVTNGTGPVRISRVNRQRTVTLAAVASGRALGDVANDLQAAIATVPFPPGYQLTFGGQVSVLNSSISALVSALLLALVLEYMLLVALYESFMFPLVRLLVSPLGLVGALVMLYLTGNTINIFSIIGMIMAEGLVAKSGILLVDYTNTLRGRGMGRTEALTAAAQTRLRPILMTSATMIFGMIPMALKLESGAETRAPMAVVVIGALLSSTVLAIVVVPAIYTIFDDLQRKLSRRPAVPEQVLVAAHSPAPALAHAAVGVGDGASGDHNGSVAVAEADEPEAPAPGWLRRLRGQREN